MDKLISEVIGAISSPNSVPVPGTSPFLLFNRYKYTLTQDYKRLYLDI